jgi:hypothetical protein
MGYVGYSLTDRIDVASALLHQCPGLDDHRLAVGVHLLGVERFDL